MDGIATHHTAETPGLVSPDSQPKEIQLHRMFTRSFINVRKIRPEFAKDVVRRPLKVIAARTQERELRPQTDRITSGEVQVSETSIDRATMGRLSKALAFICGADHPTTIALKSAAESGAERDIKQARTLFLRLNPGDRKAALNMIED